MLKIDKNLIKKIVAYLAVIIVCLNTVSCHWFGEKHSDKRDIEITVLNESDEVVYMRYGLNGGFYCSRYARLAPGESYVQESFIVLKNKKEWIYQWKILKETTLDKHAEEVLVGEDIFDDIIEYDYKSLENLDFKITYPR